MKNLLTYVSLFTLAFCSILFAASDNTVDSMDYDFKIEWKNYGGNVPVKAFTVQRDNIWLLSGNTVTVLNMKTGARRAIASFGDFSAEEVTCMCTDSSGKVWIGSSTAGVAVETGATFTVYNADNGLSDNAVSKIAISNAGVWVGTASGLCRFAAGSWTVYTKENGLCGNAVTDITVDQKTGTVWVGTDKGISQFTNRKWQSHTMQNGLSWNETRALGFDARTGYLWAAVGDKDINCYTGKEWKVYMNVTENISGILCDTQSRIWCGSTDNGLVKFNGEEWVYDAAKNGIPVAHVYGTWRDEAGNLWFATEKGVLKVKNPYPF